MSLVSLGGLLDSVERCADSRIVTKVAESSIVETAGHRVQQSVEGGRIGDALDGQGADLVRGQESELDAANLRRDGLGDVHDGDQGASKQQITA